MGKRLQFIVVFLLSGIIYAQDISIQGNDDVIYVKEEVDREPVYLGKETFMKDMMKALKIPEVERNIKAMVLLEFIIEKDGSTTNVTVEDDPTYSLADAVLEAFEECQKKWKPAKKNGKAVRFKYALPIRVTIQQ